MASELCRAIAYESVLRGARVNVSELWAALEAVDDLRPKVVVDIGSGPAVWWAWWSLGARVIGAAWMGGSTQPAFAGERPPEAVTVIDGDPREASTRLRLADQVGRRPVDVLVLADATDEESARESYHAFAPMVRPGGLVLVHGIADPMRPGIKHFWRGLDACGSKELVGAAQPIGIGVIEVHGRDVTRSA